MAREKALQQKHNCGLLLVRFMDFCHNSVASTRPAHIAIYAHIITIYESCGGLDEFNLETSTAMARARVFNRNTYYKAINDLIEWGWIKDCGRNDKKACRNIGLTDGVDAGTYNIAVKAQQQPALSQTPVTPKESVTSPQAEEEIVASDTDMEKFERVFDAWAKNVTQPSTWFDRRWLEIATKDTGIRNFDIAMRLFKEHIIKFSKVKDWLGKSSCDKKSYFIFAAKHFVTNECKIVKHVVAKIVERDGKPFVQQYGVLEPLPANYPPQPDVDFYWDGSWGNWRHA